MNFFGPEQSTIFLTFKSQVEFFSGFIEVIVFFIFEVPSQVKNGIILGAAE